MQDEKSGASGGERQSRAYEGNPASSALTFLYDPGLVEG